MIYKVLGGNARHDHAIPQGAEPRTWRFEAIMDEPAPASHGDPFGTDQHAPGAKLDAGKPRVALVMRGFSRALLEVAKVGTFGAQKYSDNGWQSVPNGEMRYEDALQRHALAAVIEENDQESGLLHMAHRAWCALAALELHLRNAEIK